MTLRQQFLKIIYPLWRWYNNYFSSGGLYVENHTKAKLSFHSLKAMRNDGSMVDFKTFKGKKILIVNTASDCGYTGQLRDLEKLYRAFAGKIEVIGFPSNDFAQQEKRSDEQIAIFCKKNYDVSFPLMKKGNVKKGERQQEVFKWLTNKELNGWNDKLPYWNFCKYIR